MVLTNIETNIISQCSLGLASIIGLMYKTRLYKNIWKTKYNLNNHSLKSSVLLSSCKLIFGMITCHIFNLFTANINCSDKNNSLIYYPMYTLVTGFELGYIFIEPVMVHLLRKLGVIYNITGLRYPDIYPNLKKVYEIIDIKFFFIIFTFIYGVSLSIYFSNSHSDVYLGIFVIILLIFSIIISFICLLPFHLESNPNGMRKIELPSNEFKYISKKDLYINIGSWIFIKILMKSIWTIYILNSSIKNDLCNISKQAVFDNKITDAFFYMVFCSIIINTISVCYQYIFMNGDKIKSEEIYYNNNTNKLKKIMKNIAYISFFSSIIWIFYIIEEIKGKNIKINYSVVAISTTLFPSGIYLFFILLKKIILYFSNYRIYKLQLLMNDFNEILIIPP